MFHNLDVETMPFSLNATYQEDVAALELGGMAEFQTLCARVAGHSPFLFSLMRREASWVRGSHDQAAPLDSVLAELAASPIENLPVMLRQAKRRVALYSALADIAGLWSLEEVTAALTNFADLATDCALKLGLAPQLRRGKIPGKSLHDLPNAGGMTVLAMGKMGAHELNYSSDIDLICLFDDEQFAPSDLVEARAGFIKATRAMSSALCDITDEGYVFRTDLRLRPDPSVTPVCISMDAAERYYESLGRAWERAAYIKARACAGDTSAGERFLQTLHPFVWRKHLDFTTIQDAHDMRLRIRESKGLSGPITLPGHHMKLGRGGIREIEFFAQTRQLIAGGRDPDLRVKGTCAALGVLAEKRWIPEDIAAILSNHYRHFRTVEHRLQMVNDAQTHVLPNSAEGMARLAGFLGQAQTAFEQDLHRRLNEVHDIVEAFYADATGCKPTQATPEIDPQLLEITQRWPGYPALRSARAAAQIERLRPVILHGVTAAAHPREALLAFDKFLSGLPAGVQIFALFEANPQLIALLLDIISTAPDLAQHLSRNAQVLDVVIGGGFFDAWPGQDALQSELSQVLSATQDYEAQLDASRRWAREWHFRVGVHLLRGIITTEDAMGQYAHLAHAALAALWPIVCAEFAKKHGVEPGKGAAVMGMGSLGAGRLTANSDLDLVVIYDADGIEMSDGRKPLAARTYYSKLTKALITAVSAPMAEGRLYEVDMRLRPSGNQGPVALSWAAFEDYQKSQAWVWEHMALCNMSAIAGNEALASNVLHLRDHLLGTRALQDILREVHVMRHRIFEAKRSQTVFDVKIGLGKLQDIELLAQGAWIGLAGARGGNLAIEQGLALLETAGLLPKSGAQRLAQAHSFFQSLQIAVRLLMAKPPRPEEIGKSAEKFLQKVVNVASTQEIFDRIEKEAFAASELISQVLAPHENRQAE